MKLIIAEDYLDMSQKAANIFIEKVRKQPSITLGLATGSTPKGVYEILIHDHKNNGTDYSQVKTVNLDEYVGISIDDPNSYHQFMMDQLFRYINIEKENTFIPNGEAEDLQEECERYERLIQSLGGIDLQLLGIGNNGHIGFNEPNTPFHSRTHIVTLAESTRIANSRFFHSLDEVPKQAITMGIATIMEAKEILLLASGKTKADAIYKLFNGPVDENFPASILQKHANVTVIADQEACSLLEKEGVR